jgi:VanZ family protein
MIKLITLFRPHARYFLIFLVIAILAVSSIPNLPTLKIHTAKTEFRLDYLIHFCEYGVLAFVAFLSFAGKEFKIGYRKVLLIVVSLIVFAVLDELHQKLIPGRTYNIKDIMSNVAGIVAVTVFTMFMFRAIGKTLKESD